MQPPIVITQPSSWQNRVIRVVFRLFVKLPLSIFGVNHFAIKTVRFISRGLASLPQFMQPACQTTEQKSPVTGLWVTPPNARSDRIIYFVHGGAFIIGSTAMYLRFANALGHAAQAKVFMIDYRLAPDYPFPQGLEDVERGWHWLNDHYGNQAQLAIAGDSAGGNLALVTLLKIQEKYQQAVNTPTAAMPKALVLAAPWTDLTLNGQSIRQHQSSDPYIPTQVMPDIIQFYLHNLPADNPHISPLLGDFHGFPPMLVHVSSDEVLLDDAKRLVAKASDSKVDAQLTIWPPLPHVFQLFPQLLPEARQSIAKMGQFIDKHFM